MVDDRSSIVAYVEHMAAQHERTAAYKNLPPIATAVTFRALASDIASGLDLPAAVRPRDGSKVGQAA